MNLQIERSREEAAPADSSWPAALAAAADSATTATCVPVLRAGQWPRPGTVYREALHIDMHWHFHDMHKLLYAFEGAVEVESLRGHNEVPRQLAAWIPAGVPHRTSIHGIRWVSLFLPPETLRDDESRVRTIAVSPLMREMLRESMRWPLDGPDDPVRAAFFPAMTQLCSEWIGREANFLLPAVQDPRVRRALDFTAHHIDLSIGEICRDAGLSERSLRRHLKAETGITWEAYRQRVRVLRATHLLGDGDLPVGEIAARCGFENPSSLSKVFRQEMGESPRDYRARVRSASSR